MANIEVRCPSCKKVHTFPDLVPFRAECDACSADLHVCIACRLWDRYVENECREDQAEPVANKDRRNLCEYFRPLTLGADSGDAADEAKRKLAALFGGAPAAPAPAARVALDDAGDDAAAVAKKKLDALFNKKS
jgi:hypothetical protein